MTQAEYWMEQAEAAADYARWCTMYANRLDQENDEWRERTFKKLRAAAELLRKSLPA